MQKKIFKGPLVVFTILFGFVLVLGIGAIVLGYTSYGSTEQKGYNSPEFTIEEDTVLPMGADGSEESLEYKGTDLNTVATLELEDRSLIKTGNISVAVEDIDATLDEIDSIENEYDAMKISLNDFGRGINREVSVTIKVVEDQFEELYADLKEIEGEYESSSIAVSDVTETVTDLETRLRNYRSVESQYLSILESAESVEDTLAVYEELNRVRLDIERVETQLKSLENQTEYSYIYFQISQSNVGAELEDDEWQPVGVFKEAARALVNFAKSIGNLLIWLVVFSPVVAIIVVPIVLVKKRAKK
jgi:putative lipoic acid-binding regulatory protein